MKNINLVLGLSSVFLMSACLTDEVTTPAVVVVGSCLVEPEGTKAACLDFIGAAYTTETIATYCTALNGTTATTACVTTGKIGTCSFVNSTSGTTVNAHAFTGTAEAGAAGCTAGEGETATWTAGLVYEDGELLDLDQEEIESDLE